MNETDLYAPIKAFLQAQGYEVKAEITDCDVIALRGEDPPVIVELKLSLSLELVMQGVDRQAISDAVYIAVPAGKGKAWTSRAKAAMKICKRLGLGLISVRFTGNDGVVLVHNDPGAHKVHKLARRQTALLREFQRRVGDPNIGGQTRRVIMTAYRQDTLRMARALLAGPNAPAELRKTLGIIKAPAILQKNHYGWFIRIERGVYGLSDLGVEAVNTYAEVLKTLPD